MDAPRTELVALLARIDQNLADARKAANDPHAAQEDRAKARALVAEIIRDRRRAEELLERG